MIESFNLPAVLSEYMLVSVDSINSFVFSTLHQVKLKSESPNIGFPYIRLKATNRRVRRASPWVMNRGE